MPDSAGIAAGKDWGGGGEAECLPYEIADAEAEEQASDAPHGSPEPCDEEGVMVGTAEPAAQGCAGMRRAKLRG